MKETTIAFVSFFMMILLIIQVKLIGRLRKLRKKEGNLSGRGYYLESFDALCLSCEICSFIGDCCECAIEKEEGSTKKTDRIRILDPKEEKAKVMVLMNDKEKSSIWWLSHNSGVHKKRVREIFAENPDYLVEAENVYTKQMLSEEELKSIEERIEKERDTKQIEEDEFDIEKFEVKEQESIIKQNPMALIAFLLGILAIVFVIIPFSISSIINFIQLGISILAIIIGIVGIMYKYRKGYAIIGAILGLAGIIFWILGTFSVL